MKQLVILFLLFFSLYSFAQDRYDEWLRNEGYYLLTPDQKEAFRKMSEPQKEIFIRNLWAGLDPDPLTPENEFQQEYMKRFQYAKKHFGIPSDRAKIYLLLGPPNSMERHHNSDKYYPLELWSYYSLGIRGLPSSLELIFFKRWGVGDFRLYSPLFDGMKALTPSQLDFNSLRTQALLKSYFDPHIVEAAEHITTGASPNESEEIRLVLTDPNLIRRFEQKRPTVETTVVYEGFQADVYTYSVPYRDGLYRISIAIAIPPRYLTFEKEGEEYRGRIDLIGRISDERGHEILRIQDNPALKMNQTDFERTKSFFFSYMFDAYLLPGTYTLDFLYRDYASNTAGRMEETFQIKETQPVLQLLPLLLAYKADATGAEEAPFAYGKNQFYPKENRTFNPGQQLIFYSRLMNPTGTDLQGVWRMQLLLSKDGINSLHMEEDLPVTVNVSALDIARRVSLEALTAGTYTIILKLSRGDIQISTETTLNISTEPQVLGRIRVVPSRNAAPEIYHSNLALQYFFRGDYTAASRHARIALDFAPSFYAARSLAARIEQARGNLDSAIRSYEKLLEEAPGDSEGFFLVGKWSAEKQDWKKAAQMLRKAMSLGYYNTELLNRLAQAEQNLGNQQEAIEFWEKSLELDSHQPEIRRLLSEIKQN